MHISKQENGMTEAIKAPTLLQALNKL